MLQLVYTSSATADFEPDGAADLCRQAAANNAPVEITGILSIRAGRFLQVLEGPKAAVEDTFIRIIRDPRHHEVKVLSRRLITRREFGEWSMALYDELAAVNEVAARVARLAAAAPDHIRQAFADFLASDAERIRHA